MAYPYRRRRRHSTSPGWASARRGAPPVLTDPQGAGPLPFPRDVVNVALGGSGPTILGRLSVSDFRNAPATVLGPRRATVQSHVAWDAAKHSGDPTKWLSSSGFLGRNTVGSLQDALNGRDHALAERVRDLATTIAAELPPLPSRKRRRRWAEDGGDYDFDRLREFHERPAVDRVRDVRAAPGVVHLVACFGGRAGVTAEQLGWCGAPALAVARALLDAGYSVSLDGFHASRVSRGRTVAFTVTLLEAGSASEADDAALAGIVCDSATYRTHGFDVLGLLDPELPAYKGSTLSSQRDAYRALAEAGHVAPAVWLFDRSFDRAEALAECRRAIAAIVAGVATYAAAPEAV